MKNLFSDTIANSRQRVYIKRQADFDRLSQHAQSDDEPLIIYGESGSGKTALLANWGAEYQQNNPDKLVIWHFCGSSADSTHQFEQFLINATKPIILIIDGINQLQETEITRDWLHYIPVKTRLFVSTQTADDLPADWQRFKLELLEKSARQALITEYLQQYGKRLANKSMQELLAHSQTANPLYLQVILDELLVFGEFDKLEDQLKEYLQAETIPDLYDKVLARLEANYQSKDFPHLVADTLSLLWAARQGLNEAELLKILNIPQAIWSPLYLALQNFLVSSGGLLNLFHDCLKQAVENRYLSSSEDQQQWHLRLANYFDQQQLDSRVVNELPWQLQQAGENKRLRSCITDIPMFLQIVQQNKYDLLSYWQNLGDYEDMENAYIVKLVIATWKDKFFRIARFLHLSKREPVVTGNVLLEINNIFLTAGCYSFFTLRLNRVFLKTNQKNKGNEHPDTAICMNNLANLYYAKGDYDNAEPLYQQALEIFEKVFGVEHPNTVTIRDNLDDCRAEMD
jgi:nephrocystin-3